MRQLERSGATWLLACSRWRRSRLVILCYHGVSLDDEHEWRPSLFISADDFRSRLRWLRDHRYNVLPLGEAIERLYRGALPPRAAALTFDDGLYDFYARAHPALASAGFPSTVYLATYYSRHQRPVFDSVCSYILWKGRGQEFEGEPFVGERGPLNPGTEAERNHVHSRIRRRAAAPGLSAAAKDDLAARLAACLGVDYGRIQSSRIFHLMTAEEVREVARGSVDVQLHTHRHTMPRDRALFHREISDNRVAIREMLGEVALPHFCYPSGDIHACFLPWLEEEQVRSATTCEPGLANRADHPLMLPRVVDSSTISLSEFEGWVSGLSSFLPTLRKSRDWRRSRSPRPRTAAAGR